MAGLMTDVQGEYNPFDATPHLAEFEALTRPQSLRSLLYINSTWLRNNSVLFDVMYRKAQGRLQANAFGPGVDPNEHVTSPVKFEDMSPANQARARQILSRTGYYVEAVKRLHAALTVEHVPVLFALQPELILSAKALTPTESRFADYTRQVNRRRTIYLYEQLQPEISRQMTEAAARDHFTFVDLGDVFNGTSAKTFTDYCHMTPLGNELVAERMLQTMESSTVMADLLRTSGQ
jgi:hypothetical protein